MTSLFRFLILILCFTSFLTIQPAGAAYIGVGDTRPAIEEALQQRLHPEQIAGRIVTLIRSADYEEAERILSDLLVAKTVDLDGYRLLEKVYLLLSFSRSIKLLDAWCANSPTSHHPFTVRGMYYLDKARILDGTNQTLLLNEKQRRNFNVYLHKSQADLEIAYDLNPQDPGAPAALTALAIQLKLPRSDMERWFARSVSADPAWLGSYRAKLIYLAPWRYGSDQLMEQFAIQCFEDKDPRSNTYIITLDWIKIKSGKIGTSLNQIRFLTNPAIYSMLSRGLERYIDASPLSPQIDTYQSLRHIIISQPYVSVAAFSDALTQPPKNTELLKGRISTFLESKRFDEAETDLKTLEDIEGPSPFSLVSRATVVYRSRNDLDTGTRLYDDAIESETSSYRRKHYLLERAEINRSYGRYALAIDDFSAALKEDILFEEAYLGRAKSNYALGNLDTALADLIIIKSSIRGRLTTQARSLINTYIQAERNRIAGRGKTGKITPNPLLQVKTSGQLPEPSETKDKTPNNGYREHLISGLRQFYQKDYDTARQNFYRAIASNPAAAKAYFMLGMIAEQVNFDHPKARIFYEQAFRLEPAVPDYILGVARTRYRDKQFTPALNTLSDYIDRIEPLDSDYGDHSSIARIYFFRGLCLEELGMIPEAMNDMKQALQLDPQLKAAAIFIIDHAVTPVPGTRDETVKSAQHDRAESTKPARRSSQELLNKGRRAMVNGDVEQARIYFLSSIRLNPEASEAYYELGRISFEFENNYQKAKLYYGQAIDNEPGNPQYHFDRAAVHYYYRQYDLAVNDFTRGLGLQPDNEQSIYYRGVCNHMLGNIDQARQDFTTLRRSGNRWDTEIDRFRNSWNTEMDDFLDSVSQ